MSAVVRGWSLIVAVVATTVVLTMVLATFVTPGPEPEEGTPVPVSGIVRDVVDVGGSLAFVTGDGVTLVDPETSEQRAILDVPGLQTATVAVGDRLVLVGPDSVEAFGPQGERQWRWQRPAGVDVSPVAATRETTTLAVDGELVGIGEDGGEEFRTPCRGSCEDPGVRPRAGARTYLLPTVLADPGSPPTGAGPRLLDPDNGEVVQSWAEGRLVFSADAVAVVQGAHVDRVTDEGAARTPVTLPTEPDVRGVVGSSMVFGAPANPYRTLGLESGTTSGPGDLWDTIDEAPSRQVDTSSDLAKDAFVLVMAPGRDRLIGGVDSDASTWTADLDPGVVVTVGWHGIAVVDVVDRGPWPMRRPVGGLARVTLLDPATGDAAGEVDVPDVPGRLFVPRQGVVVTAGAEVRIHRVDH